MKSKVKKYLKSLDSQMFNILFDNTNDDIYEHLGEYLDMDDIWISNITDWDDLYEDNN